MSAGTEAAARPSLQGNYSGGVSRLAAYAIDAFVSAGLFVLALAGGSYVIDIVTRHHVSWSRDNIVVAVVFAGWQFLYFAYSWATTGKTPGMAILGIRVVRADGAAAEPVRAVIRTLAFPLSFLLCGLGFAGILVQREHRALHDVIAGTAVVYAWDARAARVRLLAARADAATGRQPPVPGAQPSATVDATPDRRADS